jgi:hypothetical protein
MGSQPNVSNLWLAIRYLALHINFCFPIGMTRSYSGLRGSTYGWQSGRAPSVSRSGAASGRRQSGTWCSGIVSHPLSMQEALGPIPSVSTFGCDVYSVWLASRVY